MNPVLERELRVRVRSWRVAVTILVYLVLVGLVVWVAYEAQRASFSDPFDSITALETARIGRSIFDWTLLLLLLLVHFTVPGVGAGMIAGERERQTLVPLQVTLLRPRGIVLGKIAAAVAFVVLLTVATTPAFAISYLVGGVALGDILRAIAAVLATTTVLACVAAWCSATFRRVQVATVVAYAAMVIMTLGSFAAYGAAAVIDSSRGNDEADPPAALLVFAPIVAVSDFVADDAGGDVNSPFEAVETLTDRSERRVAGNVVVLDDSVEPSPPFWMVSAIALAGLSVLAVWLASRRINTPAETER